MLVWLKCTKDEVNVFCLQKKHSQGGEERCMATQQTAAYEMKRQTRATGEVQKKITPSPVARDSRPTPARCLPGNHEKIAPVLQTAHETTVFI